MAKKQKPRHPLADARMTPDLAWYDRITIDSSAGKDSQVQLDVVVSLADAMGVSRDKLVVVHCDLGEIEWEGTLDLARRQAAHYGLRFEVVRRPQGDLLEHVEQKGLWPGFATRYCTSDHKTAQVYTLFTRLVNEMGGTNRGIWDPKEGWRPARILDCLGLRAQESDKRAERPQLEFNARASNGKRHVDTWLPIKWWSLEQVWERIHATGVPYHYAYDLGMPRLSCVFCIYAPEAALALAGYHNRPKLAKYARVEAKIGHKFTIGKDGALISLVQIQAKLEAGHIPGRVTEWNDCAA